MTTNKEILRSFTGLRGMACISVALSHCITEPHMSGGPRSIESCGTMAVYFFFCLSGYLLSKRALVEIQPHKDHIPNHFIGLRLVNYATRRFFRIYPAFFLSIMIYHFAMLYVTDEDLILYFRLKFYQLPIVNSLLFINDSSHMWTLGTEMKFYFIMLPVVFVIAAELIRIEYKYAHIKYVHLAIPYYVVVTIITIYFHVINGYIVNGWEHRANFFVSFPVFWYGCLGGIISHYIYINNFNIADSSSKIMIIVSEITSYAILLKIFFSNQGVSFSYFQTEYQIQFQSQVTNGIFYALLLLILEVNRSNCSLARFTSHPWIYYVGEWSYSIYLIHYFIIMMIQQKTRLMGLEATSLCIALSIFSGFLIFQCVESPSVKFGNKIIEYISLIYQYIEGRLKAFCLKEKKSLVNQTKSNQSYIDQEIVERIDKYEIYTPGDNSKLTAGS